MQVDSFLATHANLADPDDLYVFWAGANDIFFGAAAGDRGHEIIAKLAYQNVRMQLSGRGRR